MQNWIKQGQIYKTRAQIPTVYLTDKFWRIYFADRTSNKSFIRYLDVEPKNPKKIIYEHKTPILESGALGAFDKEGQMPSCLLEEDEKLFLFYIGWSIRQDVPYHNSIGLAVSEDRGNTFKKLSNGPILTSSSSDPFFVSTPYVLKELNMYRMWYLSATEWVHGNPPEAKYCIKTKFNWAHNIPNVMQVCWNSGINTWMGSGYDAINYKSENEGGICRPIVIPERENLWKMWYCYRDLKNYRTNKNNSYRIGYAEAESNWLTAKWVRKDQDVNLTLSDNEFDSEMLCYPFVVKYEDTYYMFYNGNNFGETGFGYATLNSYP